MIPLTTIRALSTALETYRSEAAGLVLYDHSRRGNYSNYGLGKAWDKLDAHDPTGFASAMLLDEMIENVIKGAKVELHRVLRDPDYLDSLKEVLRIKDELAKYLDSPRSNFIALISNSLAEISPDDAAPTSLEVAVCMRDAIFAIDGGLKLRWMLCDTAASGDAALSPDVRHYPTMPHFIDSLMSELPYGAHLCCVAGKFTVIGLKNPGRVAYLSTLTIDRHTGNYQQGCSDQYNAADFDLTKPKERYPNWDAPASRQSGSVAQHGSLGYISRITQLERDQILWLALVIEMTKQKMLCADPSVIALSETMTNALAGFNVGRLPALRNNYAIETPSIAELFESYGFNDWTKDFMRPALDGLTIDHVLPISDEHISLHLDARTHSRTLTETELYSYPGGAQAYRMSHVPMRTVSPSLSGTKAELEEVRNWVLAGNLLAYLMTYLNVRFAELYVTEAFPQFAKRIQKNLRKAVSAGCTTSAKFSSVKHPGALYFYSQSMKHKTYNPRCYFGESQEPSHVIYVEPQNSAEIAEVLGFKSEKDLPEFIHGWSRTSDDPVGHNQIGIRKTWPWNGRSSGMLRAHVEKHGLQRLEIPSDGCYRASVAVHSQSVPECRL